MTTDSWQASEANALPEDDTSLLELLDRLLDTGVVLAGELHISVAGVDLLYLNLRVLLCSSETFVKPQTPSNEAASAALTAVGESQTP